MATSALFNRVNINGVPCLESKGVTVSSTAVTFNFNAQPWCARNFSGLIAIRIDDTYEAPATALPIQFNVPSIAGTVIPLTKFGAEAVTSTDLATTGILLVFYDRQHGELQLVSSLT